MDHIMTICVWKELHEHYLTAVPLNSAELFSLFQLIVLVLQPSALLVWFSLVILINPVSSRSSEEALISPLYTTTSDRHS